MSNPCAGSIGAEYFCGQNILLKARYTMIDNMIIHILGYIKREISFVCPDVIITHNTNILSGGIMGKMKNGIMMGRNGDMMIINMIWRVSYLWFQVFNGLNEDSLSFGRYCGNLLPAGMVSTGSDLLIKFKSDATNTGTGFRVEYSSCALR